MPSYLEYRAGRAALARIRSGGLSRADLRTWIAPATGPKWLVSVGFDRALVRAGVLAHGGPVLLAGASAGAWRALVLACRDPLAAHDRLLQEYVGKVFTRAHTPQQISDDYRATLERVITRADAEHALAHPYLQLALHAVRVKGWVAAGGALQKLALGAAATLHAVAPDSAVFFEPTVFTSASVPGAWLGRGATPARLTADNLHAVALASGSVPMYMAPVPLAHAGAAAPYLDGGLSDYHVRRRLGDPSGIALLFSHQRRIIPAWFDKYLPWRAPPAAATDNLLLVYPNAAFLDLLVDREVPSREDFTRFLSDPAERIRRWRIAAAASERLGEQFVDDLDGGKIAKVVRAL